MGGMGSVYRAVQPNVEREVAIKIILPAFANHPDFIRRFEARRNWWHGLNIRISCLFMITGGNQGWHIW